MRTNSGRMVGAPVGAFACCIMGLSYSEIIDETRGPEPRRDQKTDRALGGGRDRHQGLGMPRLEIVDRESRLTDRLPALPHDRGDRSAGRHLPPTLAHPP